MGVLAVRELEADLIVGAGPEGARQALQVGPGEVELAALVLDVTPTGRTFLRQRRLESWIALP